MMVFSSSHMKMLANNAPRGGSHHDTINLHVHFVVGEWCPLCAHDKELFQVFLCDFCFNQFFIVNFIQYYVDCVSQRYVCE